jgi:hypothetical protein
MPYFLETYTDSSQMNPQQLAKHLKDIHGIMKPKRSRKEKRKALAEKSSNASNLSNSGGNMEGNISNKIKA